MSSLRRMVASAAAVIGVAIATAPAASAHAGGRAQLYIARFTAQPGRTGWDVQVTLIDADSGQPEPGFAVSVSGTGPSGASFGPVDLAESTTNRGRYSGAAPATPGQWTMLVNAHDVPGGPAAVAISRRYDLTLTATASATVTGPAPHSRSSRLPLTAGVVLSCACAVGAARLARANRRRPDPDCEAMTH